VRLIPSLLVSLLFVVSYNALAVDSEPDGMDDDWENFYNLTVGYDDSAEDSDMDGLANLAEFTAGTRPDWADSDYDGEDDGLDVWPTDSSRAHDGDVDGLSDEWESAHGLDPFTNDGSADFDMDGLNNLQEYIAKTNPANDDSDHDQVLDGNDSWPTDRLYYEDTDSDGMPDRFEILNSPPFKSAPPYLDYMNAADAGFDMDGDSLTNLQEFTAKTNWAEMDTDGDFFNDDLDVAPFNPAYTVDTDGDGLPDEYEMEKGLNPNFVEPLYDQDMDSDGLNNLQEYQLGTEPTYFCGCPAYDSDDDGVMDGEDRYPVNPLYQSDVDFNGISDAWQDMNSIGDAFDDPDGDGLTNLYEFLKGTNPWEMDSDQDDEPDGYDFWPTDSFRAHDWDQDNIPDEWEEAHGIPNFPSPQPLFDDEDGDGLYDWQEYESGSNPNKMDSDGDLVNDGDDPWPMDRRYAEDSDEDGLPDLFEWLNSAPVKTSPPYLDYMDAGDAAFDSDGDNLSNLQEFKAGSNWTEMDTDMDGIDDDVDVAPLNPAYTMDMDMDGLPDEYEMEKGLDPNDPEVFSWNFDMDGDGLSNLREYQLGTNPTNYNCGCDSMDTDGDGWQDALDAYPLDSENWNNTDGDGIPSSWEQQHGTNVWSNDGAGDVDVDGLTNLYEYLAKTDPQVEDSDGDGVLDSMDVWPMDLLRATDDDMDQVDDGWELSHDLPVIYGAVWLFEDADTDGLYDWQEYAANTNPRQADTDRDGVSDNTDLWPLDSRYAFDTDGDRMPDEFEKAFAPPHKTSPPYLDYLNSGDAFADQDVDYMNNVDEFLQGSIWLTVDTDGDHTSDNGDVAPANPLYAMDTDGDGLPDEYEIAKGLNPAYVESFFNEIDPDNDGLTNLQEYKLGTEPTGMGCVCDPVDSDGDGYEDGRDHYPLDPAEWQDGDFDGMADNWESTYGLNSSDSNDGNGDGDSDGVTNRYEYAQGSDPTQVDSDGDTYGDNVDRFPADLAEHLDSDGDGVGDVADLFPNNPVEQSDADNDGIGDQTDTDDDNDGVSDVLDTFPLNPAEWEDWDGDGTGNNADTDDDNDTVLDASDNCPLGYNTNQLNTDGDSQGNVCDDDDDNDGVNDTSDPFPLDDTEWADTDRDLIGNNADLDDDSDGMPDVTDPAPLVMYNYPNLYTFNGDSAVDYLGAAVSSAGDVNNDGYGDVIAGAYLDENGLKTNSGSARVYSGLTGATLYTFYGDASWDNFGHAVSGAGDVNNDGYDDQIVGAYLNDGGGAYPDRGMARVFSGLNGAVLYTFTGDSALDNFGFSVGGAGDVNQDGYEDVIVGARYDANNGVGSGSAKVFSGLNGNILYTFNGDSPSDYFGYSVSGAGDVNGDGYDDVIVGAQGDDNNGATSGSARVLSGINGSILYTFSGDAAGDYLGWSVSGAGDVNNDGYDDVMAGAFYDDNNFKTDSGSVRVWSGKTGAILYTFNGIDNFDAFGTSVRAAGDVNNDNYADLIAGSSYDDNNGTSSGSARVLSGRDGSILYTFNGDTAEDYFGHAVSAAGDVNGDGFADLLVGAFADDNLGRVESGSARVFSGAMNLSHWDTDNDGHNDNADAFRLDAAEWQDTDGDAVGNNADWDDDNDGVADTVDAAPLDAGNTNEIPLPLDGAFKGTLIKSGSLAQ